MGPEQNNPAGQEAIKDAKGRVLDGRSDPTHPLVSGRTRPVIKTALEIAETPDPTTGELAIDPVVFRSVSSMDWEV